VRRRYRFVVVEAHATPEAAALAGWAPAADARVVRVEQCSDPSFPDRVWVFVDTNPSHPMRASCELTDAGWVVVSEMSD
jgi:hypothetical protein